MIIVEELIKRAFPHRVEQEILLCLWHHGSLTRSSLCELTGRSRTTVYDAIQRIIIGSKMIEEIKDLDQTGPGRPAIYFDLNPGWKHILENLKNGNKKLELVERPSQQI